MCPHKFIFFGKLNYAVWTQALPTVCFANPSSENTASTDLNTSSMGFSALIWLTWKEQVRISHISNKISKTVCCQVVLPFELSPFWWSNQSQAMLILCILWDVSLSCPCYHQPFPMYTSRNTWCLIHGKLTRTWQTLGNTITWFLCRTRLIVSSSEQSNTNTIVGWIFNCMIKEQLVQQLTLHKKGRHR